MYWTRLGRTTHYVISIITDRIEYILIEYTWSLRRLMDSDRSDECIIWFCNYVYFITYLYKYTYFRLRDKCIDFTIMCVCVWFFSSMCTRYLIEEKIIRFSTLGVVSGRKLYLIDTCQNRKFQVFFNLILKI